MGFWDRGDDGQYADRHLPPATLTAIVGPRISEARIGKGASKWCVKGKDGGKTTRVMASEGPEAQTSHGGKIRLNESRGL